MDSNIRALYVFYCREGLKPEDILKNKPVECINYREVIIVTHYSLNKVIFGLVSLQLDFIRKYSTNRWICWKYRLGEIISAIL